MKRQKDFTRNGLAVLWENGLPITLNGDYLIARIRTGEMSAYCIGKKFNLI